MSRYFDGTKLPSLNTLHISLVTAFSLLLYFMSSQSHLGAGLAFPSVEYGGQSDITKSTVDSERVNSEHLVALSED